MTAAHRLRRLLAAPFARHPYQLQRLRWPNPCHPPYLQQEINLYRPGELGDVLMCLAVVRAIRQRNPRARITFITHYEELLTDHPLLDRVMSPEAAQQARISRLISLRYEVFVPLRLHMIDYLGGCVGLREVERIIPLPDYSRELAPLGSLLPSQRPRIMICRKAGPFTPNKDWPDELWEGLIPHLAATATVVELGRTAPAMPVIRPGNYVDLRGRTTLRQYCALIGLADLVITPASSAVHIAAAYSRPVISLMSGFEAPANSSYACHFPLYHAVPCAPCWLRTPCPHGLKCLHAIRVDEVMSLVRRLLKEARPAH